MPSAAGVLGFGKKQNNELRVLFVVVAAIFLVFLAIPMILVLVKSFTTAEGVVTFQNYIAILSEPDFLTSVTNSLKVSAVAALISVVLAFFAVLYGKLHQLAPWFAQGNFAFNSSADVAAYHYVWFCHYLLFR